MTIDLSLHMILWLLAAIGGCGVAVLVGRSFHTCSKHQSRRGTLQHILEDQEPPHLPN